ncbi:hypothetical protein [Hymenobacter sediminicola]|uniref:Uncharacterized protein n=1 Tax=Hymenobacter sediminicola TaxID=2761579 RepID=A0A7G7W771_9BACT|nr:hypothetical protein [Hymenobacter sediminicola]QNH62214.1 hypothetical protein H4317_19095 [Hymenobacter sediminicola]
MIYGNTGGPRASLRILFSLLIFMSSALGVRAQTHEIDLSRNLTETKTVSSGTAIKIRLINMLPDKAGYSIDVQRRFVSLPPLTLPDAPKQTGGNPPAFLESCEKLKNATDAVLAITKEDELPVALAKLKAEIAAAPPVSDANPTGCSYELLRARVVIDATSYEAGDYTLSQGEILEVTITRQQDGKLKTWKYTYSTQARGEWQISYGFSFITQGFSKENVFFASPQDSAYTIKKESNRRKLSFAPSIFFTWVPQKSLSQNWSWSLSGGLGFDFESPTVFLGPTVSFNQNVKFNFGVVAHKQRVLLGKYEENQRITESLTEDQLHDDLYRLNPFFSLSLRFTQNPFERGDD